MRKKVLVAAFALLGGGAVFALLQNQRPPVEPRQQHSAAVPATSLADLSAQLLHHECPADFSSWLTELRGKISEKSITAPAGAMDTLLASYRKGCNQAAVKVNGVVLQPGSTAVSAWYLPIDLEEKGGLFIDPETGAERTTGNAWAKNVEKQIKQ